MTLQKKKSGGSRERWDGALPTKEKIKKTLLLQVKTNRGGNFMDRIEGSTNPRLFR